MEDQSKTLAVSVRAKEFVSYHCSCCGHCCRHIENCVMVESLDAYRMAKHLRNQHCCSDTANPCRLPMKVIPFMYSKRSAQMPLVFFCAKTSAASMLPALEPAAFTRSRWGLVSVDGILNTACALMIISSTLQQQKGIGQRLAVPQLSQRGQGIFEATVSGHPRDWPADAPYAGRNAPSSCIQDIVLSLLSF